MASSPSRSRIGSAAGPASGLSILSILLACASAPEGPLPSRGLPADRRAGYVAAGGSGTSPEIRDAFLEGRVAKDMPRDWVLQLYGRPDRTSDVAWEYLDGGGNLILGIVFRDDRVDSAYEAGRPRR